MTPTRRSAVGSLTASELTLFAANESRTGKGHRTQTIGACQSIAGSNRSWSGRRRLDDIEL